MRLESKDITQWKPNNINDCNICKLIDQLCTLYYNAVIELNVELQNEIIKQLELIEINGYKLLKTLESNGGIYGNIVKIDQVNNYVLGNNYPNDIKETLYNVNNNTDFETNLLTSRWCSNCGHRKPNIIE